MADDMKLLAIDKFIIDGDGSISTTLREFVYQISTEITDRLSSVINFDYPEGVETTLAHLWHKG